VKQVRNKQEGFGRFQPRIVGLAHADELVEGVDRQPLDAGLLIETLGRYDIVNPLRDTFGAPVAVVVGITEHLPCSVQQRVIYGPCVDPDTGWWTPRAAGTPRAAP